MTPASAIRFAIRIAMLLLCLTALPGRGQAPSKAPPRDLAADLFPRTALTYNLCIIRSPDADWTAAAHLPGLHASAQDAGTLRQRPAQVTLLHAPLALPDYGPLDRIEGRTWTGLRWEPHGLRPGLYRISVTVPIDAADSAGQPFRLPPVTASRLVYRPCPDGLRAARRKYLGKRIWPTRSWYFLGSGSAHPDYGFSQRTSLRVKSITRVSRSGLDLAMNGGLGSGWDMSPSDFVTDAPLRVVFDRPHDVEINGQGWVGTVQPRFPSSFFQYFADPWQMDRALRLTPPPDHLTPLKPGLAPAQVIAALGWPSEYGSLAQLTRRLTWRYDGLKPFFATAYFVKGKFVRYDPGGHLP